MRWQMHKDKHIHLYKVTIMIAMLYSDENDV
jgi:hypothetical protein